MQTLLMTEGQNVGISSPAWRALPGGGGQSGPSSSHVCDFLVYTATACDLTGIQCVPSKDNNFSKEVSSNLFSFK